MPQRTRRVAVCHPEPMPEIAVRPARVEDIVPSVDILYTIAAESDNMLGRMDPQRRDAIVADLASWLETGRNAIFVSTADEQVVGSLHVICDPNGDDGIGEVRLNVHADWRGRGAGRAMLDAAEAWARAAGYRKLWLRVFAPNTGTIALYERAGYEHEGLQRAQTRDHASGAIWDVVLMGKLLT
jgi:RimJ/RimL family protein N-acetyltransferase